MTSINQIKVIAQIRPNPVVKMTARVQGPQGLPGTNGIGTDTTKLFNMGVTLNRSANFTATSNNRYSVDTTSGNVTATLPATATLGSTLFIQKSDSTANILYLSGTINGTVTSTFPVRTQLQAKLLQWDGVSSWNVIAGDLSLPSLDARYLGAGGSVTSVNGYTGVVVLNKADVGLGNVDNTSDANKPVSTAQSAADALKVSKTGDTMSGNLQVSSSSSSNSTSTGGAILIENSTNDGAAEVIYSNRGATATGHLLNIRSNNTAFPNSDVYVDYKGVGHAIDVNNNGTGSNAALNLTSSNPSYSTLQVRGNETGLGTTKITHVNPSTSATADSNASGLSVDLVANPSAGLGTAAQGIYVDSTTGTTGNLLRLRNLTVDRFIVDKDGSPTVGSNGNNTSFTKNGNTVGDQFFIGTNAATRIQRSASASEAVRTQVNGDTQARWLIDSNGKMTWGTGSAVGDTTLYRSTTNTLKTDNNLIVAAAGTATNSAATIDATQTLTNKTINGSGVGNVLTNTFTLTTTGTSGAATYNGTTLNIPSYTGGGGSAGVTRSILTISTNTSAGSTSLVDYVYKVTGTTTLTLPTAVGNTNLYTVKNADSILTTTIATTAAQTIDGTTTITLPPGAAVDLYSDNTNWFIT